MKFLHIAIKDLRIRLRDRNTLVMMLLLPVGMTAIIGFAFGGQSGMSAIEFLIVAPEEGRFLADAAAEFLSRDEIFDVATATEEGARRAVAAGEKSAAVIVPDGVLESVFEGTPGEIRLLRDPASAIKAGVVQSMVEQFVASAVYGSALARGVFETLEAERPLTDGERLELSAWLFEWMRDAFTDAQVTIESEDTEAAGFDVRAYFAPGFAVLFLLFTMLTSAKTIHEERESGTYDRLMSAPLSASTILGGKLLSSYLLASLQILLLIGLGSVLFGIRWGSHPGAAVAMALSTAAGATSIAMLIAALARTERQTDNVGTAFILVMSLVGGSMWPVEQAPESFRSLARFTFNYWAHGGFKKLVFEDAGLAGIATEIGIVLAIAAIAFALAVPLLARRRV
jgi:ABC-2 type transport system permease protein